MQQFARRPEPDSPRENGPSNELLTQLLDQVSGLTKQVATIGGELASVKAENQRLRSQIGEWMAHSAQAEEPKVEVSPIVEPQPSQPAAQESVDEEMLVELVRTTPIPEPSHVEPVEATLGEPLSDDEIQRMLNEAAAVATEPDAEPQPEPESADTAEVEPTLRLLEDEPAPKPSLSFEIDYSLARKVPGNLAIAALAVPQRMEGTKLVCKAALPFDHSALGILADAAACEVVPEAAPIEEVVRALRTAYADDAVEAEREAVFGESAPTERRGFAKLFRRSA
jgi:hypothetical protein